MMATDVIKKLKKFFFRIKWLTMSDRKKYACLWSRTRAVAYHSPQFRM